MKENTILIKIGESYREDLSAEELYEATSISWVISESRLKSGELEYYCAVFENKIKEVYRLNDFEKDTTRPGRFILIGIQAEESIRSQLLDLDLGDIHRGMGNPIKYYNMDQLLQYAKSLKESNEIHPELDQKNYSAREGSQNMDTHLRQYFLKIMQEYLQAKQENLGGHPLWNFVKHDVSNEIRNLPFVPSSQYVVTGSAGMGKWADVPSLAIMNKDITSSTQRGYYIVYLFSDDMERLYLTFSQGITETPKEEMERIKKDIRQSIRMDHKVHKDDDIFLGSGFRPRQYASSTAAYICYERETMPSEEVLIQDLQMMINYYEEYIDLKNNYGAYVPEKEIEIVQEEGSSLKSSAQLIDHIYSYITSKGFYYPKEDVINLYLSLRSKPFVILSGISGTGKTKIVQWFAESLGAKEENGQFHLIPIRPDWNDGSDLLGYVDIKGDFKTGPLTKAILQANEKPHLPFFVLLDEMNLARVEYYFSDILSVMESRKWQDGKLITSTLLSKEITGFKEDVRIPSNLYIIGTVNMDETTHPFSKKVLDRANTIEFNRVSLRNLSFLNEIEETAPIPVWNEKLSSNYLHLKDVYQTHSELVINATEELEKINQSLQLINAHIGYRVRDEICFYLAYNQEDKLLETNGAFDHCILQKILPRLTGSDSRVEKLLKELYRLFTNKEYINDNDSYDLDLETAKYPNSAQKVAEMLRRLQDDGFTSFWIS